MDYSSYDAILKATIWRHLTIFLVVGALLTLGLVLNILLYHKTVKKLARAKRREAENIEKDRSRLLVTLIITVVAVLACAIMGYCRVAGMHRDLTHHRYITASASYDRPSHRRSVTDDGIAYVTIDGVRTRMLLSSGGSDFPLGEHEGVVCYARESKILLSFCEQNSPEEERQ